MTEEGYSRFQSKDLIRLEPIEEVQAPEPIEQAVKNSPGVEVEQAQEPRAPVTENSPGVEVDRVQGAIVPATKNSSGVDRSQERIEDCFDLEELWELDHADCPACGGIDSLDARWSQEYAYGYWIIYCEKCDSSCTCSIEDLPPCLRGDDDDADSENSPGVEVDPVQKPIIETVETSPGVEVDRVEDFVPDCSECFGDGYFEDESGLLKVCQCSTEPKLSRQSVQSAIAPATKNLPGSRSKTSTAHQLLELFKSSAHIIEDSPGVNTEATVSESAIGLTTENFLNAEADQNPILTELALSDRFVARYSPPQSENIRFQLEADGQLSLLDFEVQSEPEPPDPDDFESLDAFREAIARWDAEHPSSFDHCSDHLPSSVQNEASSVQNEANSVQNEANSVQNEANSVQNEASSVHDEPLEISLDSFCEWAPCPEGWYEPHTLLESKVMEASELSLASRTSSTSDFFIPTFGCLGDRPDRDNEPPDTGIFARLPKPKPPTFPPQASQQHVSLSQSKSAQVNQASRNYPETIPKLFHCIGAGSSTQPARSPPGGDA